MHNISDPYLAVPGTRVKPRAIRTDWLTQFKWVGFCPDHKETRTVTTENLSGPTANSEPNVFAVSADPDAFFPPTVIRS